MKITPNEALALASAELRPRAQIKILSKESGLREHTVRYLLTKLQRDGIIKALPVVNLHRLGLTTVNVFFTVGAHRKSTSAALLKLLSSTPEVIWIGEFGGEYQYGVAICAKEVCTVLEILHTLSAKYRGVFFDKALSVQYGTTIISRRYLSNKRFSIQPLTSKFTKEQVEIDQLDRQILGVLGAGGAPSNRDVAAKLGIPASTVDLRVKKLTESSVIEGEMFAVDCTKYGYNSFKLLIYSKGVESTLTAGLSKFCYSQPNVTYLIELLGSWDYEIGVEVPRAEDLTEIMQEIYEQFGALVTSIKVLSKFRDIKFRWYPGE